MKRRTLLLAALLAPLLAPMLRPAQAAATAGFRPLREGDYARLVAGHRGRPLLVVMWSLTCAPCRDELRLLEALARERGPLPLALVCTDAPDESARAAAMLREFGMASVESWMFAGANANRLRFEIDPDWFGEMPRAYFYAADGSRTAVSGSLQRAQLEAWFGT